MYKNEEIMQFVNLVAEVVAPDRIILFGSYAYGTPNEKSDLDLLVIKNGKDFSVDDEAKLSTAVYLKRKQRNIRTRYDVFIQTDRQVRMSAENGGAFVDAMQKGKVVYERTNQETGFYNI
ncbi:MAG: nucleotidyltransferase domain-containing protein [Clostridiales bacterium]|nr:nucleotidyltransferase domain-containing protein [Clostridiales bacterium]